MLALLLAGCAGSNGSYPSLAKRPIETARGGAAAAPAAPAPAQDPALARNIEGLVERARSGAAAFDSRLPSAQEQVRIAAGAAVSSEAWVDAQQAISALDAERYDSVFALASLDTLYVERSSKVAAGEEQGGTEAIDAARAGVLAIVDRQNDVLDGMKGALATP